MIEAMIFLGLILLAILLPILGAIAFIEYNKLLGTILLAISFVYWSWGVSVMMQNEKDHPCVQYETRMQYNAATKMMQPMQVCVLRGEWVEE